VSYDGRSLYDEYAELRYRIGMVPQDDVLHRQLTVKRALRYSASLRFADDVPRKQRNARVDEVIELLGLKQRANQRIDTLSGGQRKRTSVALELLTEPSLLCLDEPTSGLDPALDREVMRELRDLADRGRTVMVVTHSVLHLAMCDRVLVMCLGGKMGFFGPPDEVLEFFGATDYADVFEMITNDAPGWAVRYRNSENYRRHIGDVVLQLTSTGGGVKVPAQSAAPAAGSAASNGSPVTAPAVDTEAETLSAPAFDPAADTLGAPAFDPGADTVSARAADPVALANLGATPGGGPATVTGQAPPAGQTGAAPKAPRRKIRPAAPIRQMFTLAGRMLAVIASDRGYAAFLIGLPLALALITHTVPGSNGLAAPKGFDIADQLEAQRLLVVLVVGASFLGIAMAIREIVNEASIYGRERAVGVSPGAYLASKLLVFLVIDVIQVALFVWLALLGKPGASDPLIFHQWKLVEIIIPVALVAFVSTVIGLVVSALVKTVEQTTPVLVVSVMAQLVLSGGLFELGGQKVLDWISWLVPTRWGFAAGASTVNLQTMVPFKDSLWDHTTGAWWRSVLLMVVQAAVLVGLARLALRRHDPGKK